MIRQALHALLIAALAVVFATAPAHAATRNSTATDTSGKQIKVEGKIVLIEPDIELSLVTAGGLSEPRKEWSEAARRMYPNFVRGVLESRKASPLPDYDLPDDLAAESQMGQIVRLNQAVAMSIAQFHAQGSALATKKDPVTGKPRMDWSLGSGVASLREATGADYAMFTYIRDSYSSGGRTALRAFGFLLGAAMGSYLDIGGGMQVGVATLVDLRTGQVVWFNLMNNQSGDLRDEAGAKKTVSQMMSGLPL